MPFTRLRQSLIQPNGSITGSLLGTASYAVTSSYAMNGGSGGGSTPVVSVASLNNQTILYNFSSSQEATITGLTLTNNNWGINVVEEWNSSSGDIYYPSSSLLMHFSGSNNSTTFTDSGPNSFTITSNNGAKITSSISKFGDTSGLFDGVDDYLSISGNTVCNFGSSNFTVECWVRLNAMPTSDAWPTNYSSHFVVITAGTFNAGDGIGFIIGQTKLIVQSNDSQMPNAPHGMTTNTWYHIAYVRSGNNLYFFVNGSQVGTTQTLTGAVGTGATTYIGCETGQGAFFNGYMDELRVTKGIVRYTGSFATQSIEFPNQLPQYETKYIGLIGGLNDTGSDYGIQKLDDTSLKIRKMSVSGTPVSGSPVLSASVDRVYVNVLNYSNISVGSTLLGQAFTAVGSTSSYALSRSVVNPYEIIVAVDGAVQSFNDAYSVTSSTINFTENIPSGSLVDIRYLTTPNVNSASYALTASYALNGGSGGGTGSTVIIYDVLLNNLYDNVLLTYERKPEQLISIVSNDYGTQADGLVTISTAKNISTDTIASGRTVADGVAYLVTAITSSSSTSNITVSGSSVTGVAVGDEMLLINVQGDTTNYNNVGNYEFLRVSNISTNVISFNAPVSKSYGTTDNSAIGNQKVILQRVPNYSTVTITSVGSLTANSWNGSLGGIVAFKCNTLINSGSINTDGKGFRFGVGGIYDTGAGCTQYPTPFPAGDRAESYRGVNSVAFCSRLGRSATTSIGGGGGGGGGGAAGDTGPSNRSGGGGGGGANRTNGSAGSNSSFTVNAGASGGTLYNNGTTLLMFGGGGGGGGRAINGAGGNGGGGGGIVLIYANNFNNSAIINATGSRGTNGVTSDDGGGGGGGGAGGVVFIKSNYVNAVGTFSIAGGGASSGGVGSSFGTGGAGGAGGLGNQLLKYSVANVSVASVTSSFESSSLVTTTAVDPNIEDGFVDNYYVYNTVATVVSASWDSLNKAYYNTTGSVNSLTSYPIRTISSSIVYPTVVRALIFAENNDDDPWVINQDLKFYLSNNGGISYTTASLVKRGLYETGKFVYSNDINLTLQNTASLTYRLEFSSSKVINVYGTGLVWPIDLTVISSSYTAATASFAFTSSFALTASYAMNGGGGTTLTTGSTYPITSSWSNNANTASYALNAGSGGGGGAIQTGSIAGQTILYNFSSSQESTLTGLNLTGNKWGVNVIEEWNSGSGDIYFNSCSLLLHFSGSNNSTTFTDSSANNFTVSANGNVKITSSISKFGNGSGFFDGVGDSLTVPSTSNAAFNPTGGFTVEGWVYFTSNPDFQFIVSSAQGVGSFESYWFVGTSSGGNWRVSYGNASAVDTGVAIVFNTWTHFALSCTSTNARLFVNGTQIGTATVTQQNANMNLIIGAYAGGSLYYFNGYLDELRFTKGIARYTGSFVTQSVEFPNQLPQYETKYIGLVGGLNDTGSDYGVQKLDDSSLKIRKMSVSGTPVSGSGTLSASVDRVYVNVLNYDNVSISGSISNAVTASFAQTTPSGKSIALSFILG